MSLNDKATEEEKNIAIERGRVDEEKYKDVIPKEFYSILERFDGKIQQVIEINLRIDVPIAYKLLRKDNKIPIESARLMVIAKFIPYRSEKGIIFYLDMEAKSKHHVEMAEKSNIKQKEKKEKDKAKEELVKKLELETKVYEDNVKKGKSTHVMVKIPSNKYIWAEMDKYKPGECLLQAELIGTTAIVYGVEIDEAQESAEPQAIPTRPH